MAFFVTRKGSYGGAGLSVGVAVSSSLVEVAKSEFFRSFDYALKSYMGVAVYIRAQSAT